MKTRRTNPHSKDAATRLAAAAQRRGAPGVQRAQDALAHSPRMAAQRQALRKAFGPTAAPAHLQVDAAQQPLEGKEEQLQPRRAPVLQRLLTAVQQTTQRPLLLALETRVNNAVATLPAWVTALQPQPHPLLDPIQTAYALANAPLGIDNDAHITAQVNDLTPKVVAFETHAATHLAAMQRIDTVYAVFSAQLSDATTAALTKLAGAVYTCKAMALEFPDLKRKIDREVIKSNKDMKALRKANAANAVAELGRYIQAGYVAIKPLNSFYESPFDLAKDHFGAAADLKSVADTGAMQWLTQWEFHIHANVTRAAPVAPAAVGAINGFAITRGHIKPSAAERALGVSIEITDAALLGQVVADSSASVLRWAATPKGEEVLRGKKG